VLERVLDWKIALELGNQQGEAGNLGCEALDFNAVEVRKRDDAALTVEIDEVGQFLTRENKRKLQNLRKRMAYIRVFDPACGSGNFLGIAYRRFFQLLAQIVEKQRIEHVQNVLNARVVHARSSSSATAWIIEPKMSGLISFQSRSPARKRYARAIVEKRGTSLRAVKSPPFT
jgi:hypothetical protein